MRVLRILALALLFSARSAFADCPAGPFVAGDTLRCYFNTQTSAFITLAGSPVVSVYKDSSLTQSTAGVTLSVDFDSLTGLQHVAVNTAADGTFYSAGSDFQIVVTTGTVGGVSVAGATVGAFSLGRALTAATIQSGLASQASVDTIAGYLDTEIAAIKIKTDQFVFTTANRVDATVTGGSAPTAAQNAAATWDYQTTAMTTTGSIGAFTLSKFALITSGSVTIRPMVSLDGSLDLVAGDSYTNAEGRAIDFPVNSKPWPTDLTGYTVTVTVDSADGTTLFTDTLTIGTATGTSRYVRWQPTASKLTVTPGTFSYEVKATKGSEVSRLEIGRMRIKAGTT